MGVRLPAAYQQVEYLKVNPSYKQYIDTGITPKQNATRWEFKVKFDIISASETYIMGAGWENKNRFNFRVYNNAFAAAFGDGFKNFGVQADVSVAHKVVINSYLSRFAELDGIRVTGTGDPTYNENKSIYLFARNRSGAVDYPCKATIYYSKISENGVLIQDLVPCYRKSDSKPGMYDLVSGAFFVNAGTGEFTVGPDVIDSISPLMVAWRRMLMRKPPLDTSPRIAEYGKHLNRSNTDTTVSANYCYTEWYDLNFESYTKLTMNYARMPESSVITYQYRNTETGAADWYYFPDKKTVAAKFNQIRFSIAISHLRDCYLYFQQTGEILFAGKDTIYYGHRNISEIT